MKYFIVTVDTEGDDLWHWKQGDPITTKNTHFIPRFQELCNNYGFKPVWLSDYEMLMDDEFVSYIKKKYSDNNCEVGVHIHAWNTPPEYSLPSSEMSWQPYLIEYPIEVMDKKVSYITKVFEEKFGFAPLSHRAGRWAINDTYLEILNKYGYKVDCSVVPGVNMESFVGQTPGFKGPNYSHSSLDVKFYGSLVEVPVTVIQSRHYFSPAHRGLKDSLRSIYHMFKPQDLWMRPDGNNLEEMQYLLKKINVGKADYAMFMIHSSELMPGANPTFKTEQDIEKFYHDTEQVFQMAVHLGYKGITLQDYYNICRK